MQWHKLGQLFDPRRDYPNNHHPKLISHAANPLAVLLKDDIYRIYYSGRDVQSRSSVGYVDIDIVQRKIIKVCDEPVFEHGDESSFYSHGVSIGNSYVVADKKYMLFMGWQRPVNEHWRGEIGRLEIKPNLSLVLNSSDPFLSLDDIDTVSLSYPWVLQEANQFLMWYGTTVTWDTGNKEMLHTINFATSLDGDNWHKYGVAVPYELGVAQAFSRPAVIYNKDGYHMWFSYRGRADQKYRIGYAYKSNKQQIDDAWQLKLNDVGIDVSDKGWDSEMIEYPFVFKHKQQTYMLYNGNEYGLSGFGLAVLVT